MGSQTPNEIGREWTLRAIIQRRRILASSGAKERPRGVAFRLVVDQGKSITTPL
jgi:hypothetical protein